MDFVEYSDFIKKHKCNDTLYFYYMYRAFNGKLDFFSLSVKDLKKSINREWSRKSKKKIDDKDNEPYKVLVLYFDNIIYLPMIISRVLFSNDYFCMRKVNYL